MKRRVVVTGMGAVAATGMGKECLWEAVKSGRSAVRRISHFDTADYRTRIAASVEDSILQPSFDMRTDQRLCDSGSLMALIAAREACADANIEHLPPATAVLIGSAVAGIRSLDIQFQNFYTRGKRSVIPQTVPLTMANNASALLAIELNVAGPNYTICTACSSSSHAIGWGYQMIASGQVDTCLAGGAESPLSPGHVQAWDRLRALSNDNDSPERACRPFSRNRSGLVLGEGAGMLLLEEWDAALKRGAKIYAEVVAYSSNCDAYSFLQPSEAAQTRCMGAAWIDRNILPDYICAHATGTADGDRVEIQAIKNCFGPAASVVAISSIKAIIGHTLGASGALAAIATLLAMRDEVIPPTANYEQFDPGCDLDCVPNEARSKPVRRALVNAFAFGGSNAVLGFAAVPDVSVLR
ncbi:MAG: beta-ketoacyl-[acyl-carrier-protein] synthase family protein [Acidobacteria bacterium]|nr:beta-ketoacyl-[acyl-carrier-protein] synthase family protein [Acidobacteriota bacterium]